MGVYSSPGSGRRGRAGCSHRHEAEEIADNSRELEGNGPGRVSAEGVGGRGV